MTRFEHAGSLPPRRGGLVRSTVVPALSVAVGVGGSLLLALVVVSTLLTVTEGLDPLLRFGLVLVALGLGASLPRALGDASQSLTDSMVPERR